MKKIFALAMVLMLGACAANPQLVNAPTQSASQAQAAQNAAVKEDWARICVTYNSLQTLAIQALPTMNVNDVRTVKMVTDQTSPLCEVEPANAQDAIVKVTAAVTTLGTIAAVKAIEQHQGVKQ